VARLTVVRPLHAPRGQEPAHARGHDVVAGARGVAAHHQRLQQTGRGDGQRQLGQPGLVERLARLVAPLPQALNGDELAARNGIEEHLGRRGDIFVGGLAAGVGQERAQQVTVALTRSRHSA
jgi:hypothetical protein